MRMLVCTCAPVFVCACTCVCAFVCVRTRASETSYRRKSDPVFFPWSWTLTIVKLQGLKRFKDLERHTKPRVKKVFKTSQGLKVLASHRSRFCGSEVLKSQGWPWILECSEGS